MNDAVPFASAFIRFRTVFLPVRADVAPAAAGGAVAFDDGSVLAALADLIFADGRVSQPCVLKACMGVKAPGGFDENPESGLAVKTGISCPEPAW